MYSHLKRTVFLFQLPREPRRTSLINILELEDPKLSITFHLMSRLSSLTPHLDSPLSAPGELQRGLAQEALDCSRGLQATEGFLLKNLEKDCKIKTIVELLDGLYPYNVFLHSRVSLYQLLCDTEVFWRMPGLFPRVPQPRLRHVQPEQGRLQERPRAGPVRGDGHHRQAASGTAVKVSRGRFHRVHRVRVQGLQGGRQRKVREELAVLVR